jgi:hypothetical protein
MPRVYHADDGRFDEPYRCEHSVPISIDDGLFPSRCGTCSALKKKWDERLKKLDLGMHRGVPENTVSIDSHPAFAEGKLPGLRPHIELRTINTEVPKRDRNLKVWPSITPPHDVDVRSLLLRVDELSREIVRMRILLELPMPEIAEHFRLNVKTIYNRYNAAIETMRAPNALEYTDTLVCVFCQSNFPRPKKGPLARFCSDRCQIKAYRVKHGRTDRHGRRKHQGERVGRTQAAA